MYTKYKKKIQEFKMKTFQHILYIVRGLEITHTQQ